MSSARTPRFRPSTRSCKKKTGADTQKVRVYQQTDGSYSFQSAANGKWLDLDSGKLDNGTLIHFWENASTPTTHDNQKWYLSVNKDGTFKIKPRVAVLHESNIVFDLNQAAFAEGQKIQGWADNDSPAQKWLLVPVDPVQSPAATQDLEVGATGELTVTGLLPGSYTLTETVVPTGFRDSLGEISLKVNADGTVIVTKPNVFVEVDGKGALLKIKNQHEDVDLTLEKRLLHSTVTTKFSLHRHLHHTGREHTSGDRAAAGRRPANTHASLWLRGHDHRGKP